MEEIMLLQRLSRSRLSLSPLRSTHARHSPCSPLLGTQTHAEDVHATGGARLLPLEPRLETGRVEDMVARELLAARHHLLSTDDAHVVHSFQLFYSGIWITGTTTKKLKKNEERKGKHS